MIDFEASGEFESRDDIICSLEEIINQLRGCCTSGYDGDMSWSAIGGEEDSDDGGEEDSDDPNICNCNESFEPHYHCEECDCVLSENESPEPEEILCSSCYEARNPND